MSALAIHGGTPVRTTMLPYARQSVNDEDVRAVTEALRSDWLTTGPKVAEFERVFAEFVGTKEAVAVSNGTAALHAALFALGIGRGDEVIAPAMTFIATANAVLLAGGTPVFVDVDAETLLIDPDRIEAAITPKTKAMIAVDYAGQPCEYDALTALAKKHGIALLADACHALGGSYKQRSVGSLADLSTFSFHPTKPIATGEGGMITTDDTAMAATMRSFRNHGIAGDKRAGGASWMYEMQTLGMNYRLSDLQCALGVSQLRKVPGWTVRRQEIASSYDAAFSDMPAVRLLGKREDRTHAYHLYPLRFDYTRLSATKQEMFAALRAEGIGVNVHYIPVHLHPYYREHLGTKKGDFPHAERAYEEIFSLPMFAAMHDADVKDVVEAVAKVTEGFL